ncbi:MAG: helix-turn-helix transcriptional regulator [Fimbriimonadaceae bacterium]
MARKPKLEETPLPPELQAEQNDFVGEIAELDGGPTLGRLIATTRELRGISRVKLSRMTGITQNALAKYERAGLPGGKMPPSNKLAIICRELRIDPREALFASLPVFPSDAERMGQYEFENGFLDLLDDEEEHKTNATDLGAHLRMLYGAAREDVTKLISEIKALRRLTENGPDRKDPSRPLEHHDPKKLAPASTGPSPKRSRKRKPKQ